MLAARRPEPALRILPLEPVISPLRHTGISGNIGLISWGGQGLVSADYDGWLVYQDAAANLLTVRKRTNGGGTASTYTFSWTPSTATWYALALSRNSNNLRVFIDGSQIGVTTTASDNLNDSDSKGVRLGAAGDGGGPLNGFIDEVRITKGVGRYTAGYTAQTAEFPNS